MSMQKFEARDMTSTTSDENRNMKAKHLESIRAAMERRRYRQLGPRKAQATRVAFLILAVGSTISAFFRSVEVLTVTGIAGGIAYWLVPWFSAQPRTWTELLDSKLASYEPVDVDAYRALQAKSRENYLDYDDLLLWLERERLALRNAAGGDEPNPSAFLNKQI
jgi:hypothetical protein